jgi:nucleotide-binding universal stress UspA family protein
MKKGMKIIIAYDGSELSMHALNQGASLAQLTESEVTILTVIPRRMVPVLSDEGLGVGPGMTVQETMDYQVKVKEIYEKSLKEAVEYVSKTYPELKVETKLLEGRPSSSIVEEAENDSVDLIVIGSRGLGGIPGWILGSTSRRVVESCTVPILVVK